jgi:hypothetical protein
MISDELVSVLELKKKIKLKVRKAVLKPYQFTLLSLDQCMLSGILHCFSSRIRSATEPCYMMASGMC